MSSLSIGPGYSEVYSKLISGIGGSGSASQPSAQSVSSASSQPSGSSDFSSVLSDIVAEETATNLKALAAGLGTSDVTGAMSSLGTSSALLGALSGGGLTGSQLSTLLMGMMSGAGGEFAILQSLMLYTLLKNSDEEAQRVDEAAEEALAEEEAEVGDVGTVVTADMEDVANADMSGLSMSEELGISAEPGYDGSVFASTGSGESAGGSSEVPAAAWVSVNPSVTGSEGNRSAELLSRIVGQFDVENNVRYRAYKYGDDTYCNIFVWDVTSALSAEIPHYVDDNGVPQSYPFVQDAKELDANGTALWLEEHGSGWGWSEVTAEEAQMHANSGGPAVTVWYNEGGIGHVQVVVPSEDGGFDSSRGPAVAQAGARNYEYTYVADTMPSADEVRYYIHD